MSRWQCVDEFGGTVEFRFEPGLDGPCYVSTIMGPQWDGSYDAVELDRKAQEDLHRIIGEHLGLTDA